MAEHWRGVGLALGLLGGAGVACFDGSASMGLPCENDAECGPSLACAPSGCCGGACREGPATTEPTTTGSTTVTVSTTAMTLSSSSTQGQSSSESSAESTGPPVCGDGVREGDEACDEGDRNAPFGPCNEDCLLPFFYWDEDVGDNDDWCPEPDDCMAWARTDGTAAGPWGSGPYWPEPPATPNDGQAYRVVSAPFDLPELGPDLEAQIVIEHAFDFNVCKGEVVLDGGHVLIREVGPGMRLQVLPDDLDGTASTMTCEPTGPAPFCTRGLNVFGSHQEMRATARAGTIPRTLGGATVQLIVEVGYNLANCDTAGSGGGAPNAWEIYRVAVAQRPAG